jgi:hypothetical protein
MSLRVSRSVYNPVKRWELPKQGKTQKEWEAVS